LLISLYSGNASDAYAVLFGQIFGITTGAVRITLLTSVVVLGLLAVMYRPLLFASLDEEVAEARGIRVGAVGLAFMMLLALAVSEAGQGVRGPVLFSPPGAPRGHGRAGLPPPRRAPTPSPRPPLPHHLGLAGAGLLPPLPGQLLRDQPGLRPVPGGAGGQPRGRAPAGARRVGALAARARGGRPSGCYGADVTTPATPAWGRGTRVRGTPQAAALASVLAGLPGFNRRQQIHAELRRRGEHVGLTTVYRHLQVLSEDGQLDTIRDPGGEILYRRCRSEAHHHHLICRRCGSSVEVEGRVVEQWAEKVAAE